MNCRPEPNVRDGPSPLPPVPIASDRPSPALVTGLWQGPPAMSRFPPTPLSNKNPRPRPPDPQRRECRHGGGVGRPEGWAPYARSPARPLPPPAFFHVACPPPPQVSRREGVGGGAPKAPPRQGGAVGAPPRKGRAPVQAALSL